MIKKNIDEIKSGGLKIFFKKIFTISKLIVLLIPSAIFLIVIYLIRPFLLVRFQPTTSTRIGHFTSDLELYVCEKKNKINSPKQNYLDLFFNYEICNYQLLKMWKKELIFMPRFILQPIYVLNKMVSSFFPFFKIHNINTTCGDRDVHNLYEKTEPSLKFTLEEERLGQEYLKKFKIPKGSKFVTLVVRDSEYLKSLNNSKDWSYHNYRDQDLNSYFLAIEEVAKRGYYVFRVGGSLNSKYLNHPNPKIIDYTHSELKNDFLDIYLGAKCEFCISTATGFDGIARIFRRPVITVSGYPANLLTYSSKELILIRPHLKIIENRNLKLNEILSPDIANILHSKEYEEKGIKLLDNPPEEIRDVVVEMIDRLEGKWKENINDKKLQEEFWKKFKEMISNIKTTSTIKHGVIKSKISTCFLRNNYF